MKNVKQSVFFFSFFLWLTLLFAPFHFHPGSTHSNLNQDCQLCSFHHEKSAPLSDPNALTSALLDHGVLISAQGRLTRTVVYHSLPPTRAPPR